MSKNTDDTATIDDLKELVQSFCEVREWDQFHNPKDLAIGMVTESSELLDIFRFKNETETKYILENPVMRGRVVQEISDTFYFVLRFAQMNNIDLSSELRKKLKENDEKYPIKTSKGSNKKYTEL